jgi:rhodanese-related sulfurtransferase
MIVALITIGVLLLMVLYGIKHFRDRRQLEQHSITPEALHELMAANQEVLLFDVRLPLDLFTESEIIPGAKRIPPKDIEENPSLIPREKDVIVYCTCQSEKTSRAILRKALAMQFFRVRFLRGGLDGWKAKGYPVEPYRESFHLDTAI